MEVCGLKRKWLDVDVEVDEQTKRIRNEVDDRPMRLPCEIWAMIFEELRARYLHEHRQPFTPVLCELLAKTCPIHKTIDWYLGYSAGGELNIDNVKVKDLANTARLRPSFPMRFSVRHRSSGPNPTALWEIRSVPLDRRHETLWATDRPLAKIASRRRRRNAPPLFMPHQTWALVPEEHRAAAHLQAREFEYLMIALLRATRSIREIYQSQTCNDNEWDSEHDDDDCDCGDPPIDYANDMVALPIDTEFLLHMQIARGEPLPTSQRPHYRSEWYYQPLREIDPARQALLEKTVVYPIEKYTANPIDS